MKQIVSLHTILFPPRTRCWPPSSIYVGARTYTTYRTHTFLPSISPLQRYRLPLSTCLRTNFGPSLLVSRPIYPIEPISIPIHRKEHLHTTVYDSSDVNSTIFALSTPPGRSAIAIIRISGVACIDIYKSLCPDKPLPEPRVATLRTLYHPFHPPTEDTILDASALLLFFPCPRSITGEDILELHIHGGPAIIRSILQILPHCPTKIKSHIVRQADPGEFTRRAFLNDRLSLPQIEALGDALNAETEQQRLLSIKGGGGTKLTEKYETWRRMLVSARGELEALIDFSEDQNFAETPTALLANVTKEVQLLKHIMQEFVGNAVKGELLRNGISISLVGAPNVGKSSLMNRIVGREAVIVSGEAGTTRDVVDLSVDLGGFAMIVGDTAGLRLDDIQSKNIGQIEMEGIRRARKRVLEADVIVLVLAVELDSSTRKPTISIPKEVVKVINQTLDIPTSSSSSSEATSAIGKKQLLIAINKLDLLLPPNLSEPISPTVPPEFRHQILTTFPFLPPSHIFGISCAPNSSTSTIQPLLTGLITLFKEMTFTSMMPNDLSIAATTRQRQLLETCLTYLDTYLNLVSKAEKGEEVDVVLAAEELRSAANALTRITGRGHGDDGSGSVGDVHEVLGVVFERFCVGK